MAHSGTRLIDAATTLVGWINYNATDPFERTRVSGETVRLTTLLDAANSFVLVASHPGAAAAVTVQLEVAPLLKDGTVGTFVNAGSVAIPAAGGRVETLISGAGLAVAPADAANVTPPAFAFARATLTPSTPDGAYVGLTSTEQL
ncbi:hypothetical protein KBZ18_11085 [Synechococcus sp. Cruz-9H2]|uniref:hypothetical protein n=1 Tax=unclassified Synechococcus TaxID=2626047 RepID=UPI0020CDFF73|nr:MULTISPECIES: hypothetical protein [unclassified Synechococcus]MCP9820033.1 hypothetical protein [Synechococcus sp. Cruz-9H2]MCP9844339.1 hypothetical protein [Synechococcus sp. Edmonson 11F2]MCP9856463.1 hypothetical protein [Synechococcus sp. Cruz-9C9]MCP9863762.1 hypothetical protein [Synechococcus sp. Cruz-7E5]MCP9870943.1 hypothetical protein [Synechococcus sp. Cruz-7B9]